MGKPMKVKLHGFCFFILVTGLMLSACTTTSDRFLTDKRTALMSHNNPPAYVDGYLDGCASGRRMGGDKHFTYRKDVNREEREALYARGWHEGQINCRNEALGELEQQQNSKNFAGASPLDVEQNKQAQAGDKATEAEMAEMWEKMRK